ncbi:hypothetical protein B0H19DRAFT_286184 [Mycena capillaripes]|nr:hypothetical protein B0H19DRAFT_286184 [Mycena capillaripes]
MGLQQQRALDPHFVSTSAECRVVAYLLRTRIVGSSGRSPAAHSREDGRKVGTGVQKMHYREIFDTKGIRSLARGRVTRRSSISYYCLSLSWLFLELTLLRRQCLHCPETGQVARPTYVTSALTLTSSSRITFAGSLRFLHPNKPTGRFGPLGSISTSYGVIKCMLVGHGAVEKLPLSVLNLLSTATYLHWHQTCLLTTYDCKKFPRDYVPRVRNLGISSRRRLVDFLSSTAVIPR